MTTANKSSRWAWAYESVPKTAEIVAVDTTCYTFGEYDDSIKDWVPPSTENPVSMYYNYASREGQLTKLDKIFPTFSHTYVPVSPQFFSRFLKSPVDAEPLTIGVLDSGMTYPITIRHEQNGGTVPTLRQAVGCYTVGLTVTAAYNNPLTVEEEFAWCKLEDHGDRSALTTAPIASTACSVAGSYNGTPYFTWNVTHQPEVVRVRYAQKQKFTAVYDPVTDTQSINCYEYEAPTLIINAIFKVNTCWDDFHDRNARTCKFKVFKPDAATYIETTLTNCLMTAFKETGVRNRGHYEAQAVITGEAITIAANECDNPNFATNYKGVVT